MKRFIALLLAICAGAPQSFAQYSSGQDTGIFQMFGLLPPTEEDLKETPFSAGFTLPPGYQLKPIIDLSDQMPDVRNQGRQGSCAAWATAYGLKSYQEKMEHGWVYDDATLFSPSFVYNYVKLNRNPSAVECTTGMTFREALNVLLNYGVVTLSDMGYDPVSDKACLKPNPRLYTTLLSKAANFKLSSWERLALNDTDEIKFYLNNRMPVVVGMMLEQSFVDRGYQAAREGRKFVWNPDPKSRYIGYHAMLCVGYDQGRREFKLMNSWGTDWGSKGFLYMSYDKFYQFLREAYIAYDAISPRLLVTADKPSSIRPLAKTDTLLISAIKSGTYKDFDGLRVGLVYVNARKDTIMTEFTDSANHKLVQRILVGLGKEVSFYFNGDKTSLSFKTVDKAGNPNLVIKKVESIADVSVDAVIGKFAIDKENLNKSLRDLQSQANQQQLLIQQLQLQQPIRQQ